MAVYQLLVKLLGGRTQCFQFSTPTISGETLKEHIFSKTRIPLPFQRLITGSRVVLDETLISAANGFFPSCVLLLPLPGGKGGFGSLLRGAATKAGQKKTNNFDACRDMSGRRLRHVNAEKKLEEWKADAEDRKLEKIAEQFLKKKAKETKKNSSVDVNKYLEKYREDSAKCMEEVDESVRQSFEVYKDLKRKICPGSDMSSKRLKIWLGKNKIDESCSEDDNDEDEEKSVVIDGNLPRHIKEINGSSSMVAGSGVGLDGESSSGASGQSNLEQANESILDEGSSVNVSDQSSSEGLQENFEILFPMADPSCHNMGNKFCSSGSSETETVVVPESIDLANAISNVIKVPEEDEFKPDLHVQADSYFCANIVAAQASNNSSLEEPLNLEKYNSAGELEVLGMDRLKAELQAQGLKCGGTLLERASRLYLLKTTPFAMLPRKFLAKPAK
ncbi:hypothetical protein KSP39_PZI016152 [Platanthera zijinensis]|uniref:Sde2 N-terminal ubiquitin domain-containing protein n=1 Tax=Platanthera zijinensis TaxID=2320716 RepID=A0AAP0B7K5_9ASPA